MLKPWEPSPCCKDKDGKLMGRNPITMERTWDPIKQTGTLYCTICQREVDPREPDPREGA